MRVDDLKTFIEVAKQGNMSKTAETLHVGQSNITMKIKRIEEYYQVTLFLRTPYGVRLTKEGQLLYDRTVAMLSYWNKTDELIMGTNIQRELTLGAMETTAAIRLPSLLQELFQIYPSIDIHLKTGSSEDLLSQLLNYDIDAGFVAGPIRKKGIEGFPIFTEDLVLITSKALGEQLDSSFSHLENQNTLTFRIGCSYRKLLEAFLYDHSFISSRRMEFGSIDAIIGCVKNDMGISLLPLSIVKHRDDISIFELPEKYQKVETYFIYRENEWIDPFNFFKNHQLI